MFSGNFSVSSGSVFIISLVSCLTTTAAQADTVFGIYATAEYWHASMDGQVSSGGNEFFSSLEESPESEAQNVLSLRLEHPIPVIPNILVRQNNIEFNDSAQLNNNTQLGIANFGTGTIDYDFDFSHTDLALYYEILDNWLNLDLGIAVKDLQFSYAVQQNNQIYRYEDDSTVPMLYARAAVELPFTGWEVEGITQAVSFKDDSIHDLSLQLKYNINDWFALAGGYRAINIDVNADGLDRSEVDIKGAQVNLTAHF